MVATTANRFHDIKLRRNTREVVTSNTVNSLIQEEKAECPLSAKNSSSLRMRTIHKSSPISKTAISSLQKDMAIDRIGKKVSISTLRRSWQSVLCIALGRSGIDGAFDGKSYEHIPHKHRYAP